MGFPITPLDSVAPLPDVAPLDVFFVASDDPKKIVAEFARLTGCAEMPAR